jgi:MSHA pilin protein MshD
VNAGAQFRQSGLTLIELVTSMTIVAVATAGLILLMQATAGQSADPMIEQQANAIAQAYLEEAGMRSFCDPDFDADANPATPLDCPVDCVLSACDPGGCRIAGQGSVNEGARALYDDVCDYDGLSDSGAVDQTGAALPGLGAYEVTMGVDDAGVTLGAPGLTDLDSDVGQVVRINVRVSHPSMDSDVVMSVYKGNF